MIVSMVDGFEKVVAEMSDLVWGKIDWCVVWFGLIWSPEPACHVPLPHSRVGEG